MESWDHWSREIRDILDSPGSRRQASMTHPVRKTTTVTRSCALPAIDAGLPNRTRISSAPRLGGPSSSQNCPHPTPAPPLGASFGALSPSDGVAICPAALRRGTPLRATRESAPAIAIIQFLPRLCGIRSPEKVSSRPALRARSANLSYQRLATWSRATPPEFRFRRPFPKDTGLSSKDSSPGVCQSFAPTSGSRRRAVPSRGTAPSCLDEENSRASLPSPPPPRGSWFS